MSKREPAYPTRERYEWMKAVLRAPDLSWATKGVALCIIMVHFNDWDGRCDPSVERTKEGQVLGRNEQMGSIDERLVGGLRWRKAIDLTASDIASVRAVHDSRES
jgi:hypothetical protein